MKRVLGIKYPTKIRNETLYQKTGEKPISETMRKARWELFGHIMRRDRNIPAYKAMELYFNQKIQGKGFRGTRRTTLPIVLNQDLHNAQKVTHIQREHNYCKIMKLNNQDDLEDLRTTAQDRDEWKSLTIQIRKAGEAESSNDGSAERL